MPAILLPNSPMTLQTEVRIKILQNNFILNWFNPRFEHRRYEVRVVAHWIPWIRRIPGLQQSQPGHQCHLSQRWKQEIHSEYFTHQSSWSWIKENEEVCVSEIVVSIVVTLYWEFVFWLKNFYRHRSHAALINCISSLATSNQT